MDLYIERERLVQFFDGIYDCADLTFEPNDHCCSADDCGHCKWSETKNAIQKRILSIPVADVQQVVLCRDCKHWDTDWIPNHAKENEHFCLMVALTTRGDWFCADGEKRA